MARRLRTLIPIAWLLGLLLLPAVAYVAGARQPLLENREKTPFPDLNRGTVRKDHTFRQVDAAIRERLPLRETAIRTRGRLMIDLFGDSPSADVVLGKDRWLYYRPALRICKPEGRPSVPAEDALEVLARTIGASGRKPVVLVAGSKVVTHRAHRKGFDAQELDCLVDAERRIQERLEQIPGGLTIQPQLDALEARGTATFLRSDTHWNVHGRAAFANAVLDAIQPGLAARARLRPTGEAERPGDLGAFIGQERIDRDPMLTVTGTPRARFAPGEVALVGDSQLDAALRTPGADGATVLGRILPGQPVCDWTQMTTNGCVEPILGARTVVVEIVARNVDVLADTCAVPTAALATTIPGRRAGWASGASGSTRAVVPTPVTDRVQVARDRTDVPRLIRIPVAALPADPDAEPDDPPAVAADPGATRPCATPITPDPTGALVIPVLAGERVADVPLRLSGPVGAALGRPEVLTLDGHARLAAR